jgi:hypothetical protein
LRVGNHVMRSKVMERPRFIDPPPARSYIRAPWRLPAWTWSRDGDAPTRETDDCPAAYGELMHRAEHRR